MMKFVTAVLSPRLWVVLLLSSVTAWSASSPFLDRLEVYLPLDNALTAEGATPITTKAEPSGHSPAFIASGKVGAAASFHNDASPGTPSDWVINLGDLDPLYASSFTLSLWIRTTSVQDAALAGNKDWTQGNNTGWLIDTLYPQSFNLVFQGGSRFDLGREIRNGAWHHVAVTLDRQSGDLSVYSDGELVESRTLASPVADSLATGFPTLIGGSGTAAYSGTGDVDDFALWSRALSQDEIQDIFLSGNLGIGVADIGIVPALLPISPKAVNGSTGDTVTFAAQFPGSLLTYQWLHNGAPIVGATSRVLTLTDLNLTHTGSYSVRVTGYNGTFESESASLAVTLVENCADLQERLEVYLNFDETVLASGGTTHDGKILPTQNTPPRFVQGKVGSAARFQNDPSAPDISDWAVSLGNLSAVYDGGSFTMAFWARVTSAGDGAFVGNKSWESGNNPGWAFNQTYERFLNVRPIDNPRRDLGREIRDGRWHQITWVVDRSTGSAGYSLFVDAIPLALRVAIGQSGQGQLSPTQAFDTLIGGSGPGSYSGSAEIDEFAIWTRALSLSEAACLYGRGLRGEPIASSGVIPTSIKTQPQSLATIEGFRASLQVTAGGTNLRYRWFFNGNPTPDGTNATLAFDALSRTNAGRYRVTVTGDGGSLRSDEAILTVASAPRCNLLESLLVHLTFDGNLSAQSGTTRSGTPSGGSPRYIPGKLGQAVSFRNDLKSGPPSDWVISLGNLNPIYDAGSFTLCFWVRTETLGDGALTGNKDWTSGNDVGWLINQTYPSFWNTVAKAGARRDLGAEIRDGQWHHLAMIYDRSGGAAGLSLYVDGSQIGETTPLGGSSQASLTPDRNYNTLIGGSGPGTYSGSADIDDYAIWKKALSAEEVACLFSFSQQGIAFSSITPPALSVQTSAKQVQISWDPTLEGYRLEATDDLSSTNWTKLTPDTKGSLEFAATAEKQFVRLRWLPPADF